MSYDFLIGVAKAVKNGLIFWTPALLAFLANVPAEYGVVAGFIAYLLKNWYENRE